MQIEKKEKVFSGFYQLNRLTLRSNNTGESFQREQFKTPNSVGVLVHNLRHDTIILVQQFRVGPEKELLEIVAGKMENEDIGETAQREVLEETGYRVDSLELIHEFHPCPGPVTEHMSLFYAQVNEKLQMGGGLAIENEEIKVVELSCEEFYNTVFYDAKSIIAQQWLKLNKDGLR